MASRPIGLVLGAALTGLVPLPSTPSIVTCLSRAKPIARWDLPAAFREVSGLVLAGDGRIFLHGDERGVFAALDVKTGAILASYQLGASPIRGDFEDIAIVDQQLFLITSKGVLFRTALPARDAPSGPVPFTEIATKLGKRCEIESLANDERDRVLLIGCKRPWASGATSSVVVFRWDPGAGGLATPDRLVFDRAALAGDGADFWPSALSVDPRNGALVFLAGHQHLLGVGDRSGRVLGTAPLAKHRQPEGLAIAPDGTVYVADEGGKGPGRITVYACR